MGFPNKMKLYRNHIRAIKNTPMELVVVSDIRHLDNLARRNIHLHKPQVNWIKKLQNLNHETAMHKYKNLAPTRKRREKREQEAIKKFI